jgi:transcriptional regulatory protein RtcR
MSTLAPGGRITKEVVQEEISRLKVLWRTAETDINKKFLNDVIGADRAEQLDRFERVQLADVLKVCKRSKSMSEAGRKVFAVSRKNKRKTNDSDRLRKYLAKYNIKWNEI